MLGFAIVSIIPFFLALLMIAPAVRKTLGRNGQTWLLTAIIGAIFAIFLSYLPQVTEEGVIISSSEWVPLLNLSFSFYLDGLSLLFALVITGVGTAVVLYTGYYFEDEMTLGRFYMYLMGFMGAMLGVVLAGNIITMFIAWELTSVFSFMLIGFNSTEPGEKGEKARFGAMQALVVTGGGGLALILGLVMIGTFTGSFEMADVLANKELLEHELYIGFTVLIMLGAFTKSAQFPFHFWLPGAMSAPSSASAYLHSATMVKAGIYLLARMYPVLGYGSSFWLHVLLGIGLTTMFIGAFVAIRKRDLKGILAYSTVSKLGALVALIALPDYLGFKALMVGILAHALYKATLFLLTGVIEHATHTRDLDRLGGLRTMMPGTFAIAAISGLSLAGVPPFLGYVAKELLIDSTLPHEPLTMLPIIVVFISSVFMVVVALLVVWDVFISPAPEDQDYHHFHRPPLGLVAGPGAMAVLTVVLGVFVAPVVEWLIIPAVPKEVHLYLIPPDGLQNPALQISLTVLLVGPIVFALRRFWLRIPELPLPQGTQVYQGFMNLLDFIGDRAVTIQNGKVRYYLSAILGSIVAFVVAVQLTVGDPLNLANFRLPNGALTETDILEILLLGVAIASVIASIVLKDQLKAALSLGISGYAVGGVFLLESAPDVALVQFLVETISTVLIIIMMARISLRQRSAVQKVLFGQTRAGLWRDAIIATSVGIAVGLFALSAVVNRPERSDINPPIAEWQILETYPGTGVNDVVSAVLADFRGMDTLFEITVFSVAALGVLAMLTRPQNRELIRGRSVQDVRDAVRGEAQFIDELQERGGLADTQEMRLEELDFLQRLRAESDLENPLTKVIANILLPFAFMVSFAHILYGGNGPGDGFTAGVVSGLAISLWYTVFGYYEARERLSWFMPGRLIVAGLLLAFGNAFLPVLFGEPFLAHITFTDAHPAGLHLTSALVFEIAIFITVLGGVGTIMEAIAHPQEVEPLAKEIQKETERSS